MEFAITLRNKLKLLHTYVQYLKLCWLSLTFNHFGDTLEASFAPILKLVYFFVHWCGRIFVVLVITLTSSVVYAFYHDVLPYIMEMRSRRDQVLIVVYGHYLLMMIVFHYFKAVTTNPGHVPSANEDVKEMAKTSVCKRCVAPKPPRTHHCSVCKKCILKMDHHCPWLNNCVGHFNHRYFISFCIFMTMGTIFVSLTTYPLFYHCFYVGPKIRKAKKYINSWVDVFDLTKANRPNGTEVVVDFTEMYIASNDVSSSMVIYLWILCFSVSIALGLLTLWHIYLISRGETSVEKLINCSERIRLKKLGLEFINLYDYGFVSNWKLLLGFHDFRSLIRKVILPSTHHPYCNGINWKFAPLPNLKQSFDA